MVLVVVTVGLTLWLAAASVCVLRVVLVVVVLGFTVVLFDFNSCVRLDFISWPLFDSVVRALLVATVAVAVVLAFTMLLLSRKLSFFDLCFDISLNCFADCLRNAGTGSGTLCGLNAEVSDICCLLASLVNPFTWRRDGCSECRLAVAALSAVFLIVASVAAPVALSVSSASFTYS